MLNLEIKDRIGPGPENFEKFRANWVDWINATNLELISNQKRLSIQPSEITVIRNRDVKPFKLGLVFDLIEL